MPYAALADAVLVFHLIFILFVTFGAFLALKWKRMVWAHFPCVLWGMLNEFCGWWCPLTPLENWLRAQEGGEVYATSFVEHYLLPLIYPASLTRRIQFFLGAAVLLVNVLVYAFVLAREIKRQKRAARSARL